MQLQKLPGKGDIGGKSVFVLFFGWPEDCEFVEKMCFGASYSTSTKLFLLPDTFWLQTSKKACVKFANLVTTFYYEESMHRKYRQQRDLSNAGQTSRELTTPPEPPNSYIPPCIGITVSVCLFGLCVEDIFWTV